MKLLRAILSGLFLLSSVWIASYYWAETIKANAVEETKQVELIALARMFEADKAKQESIKAYTELEAKRTTVQHAIKQIVLAELKRCRKGKC